MNRPRPQELPGPPSTTSPSTSYDEPEHFAASAPAGFCALHGRSVRTMPGGIARHGDAGGQGRVVVGGGSRHYPAFIGYVGPDFADADVAGDVFASPSTRSIAHTVLPRPVSKSSS